MSNLKILCEDRVICPSCSRIMKLVRIYPPAMGIVGDHTGSWGDAPLFVCIHDDCQNYIESADFIRKNYGHSNVSVRMYKFLDSSIFSRGIIEIYEFITCAEYKAEKALYERYIKAEKKLIEISEKVNAGEALKEENVAYLLKIFLLERKFPSTIRIKAANLLPIDDYSLIDLILINKDNIKNPLVAEAAQRILEKIIYNKF